MTLGTTLARARRIAGAWLGAAGVALAACAPPACALELTLLSAGAVEPGVRPAAAAFERESGHTVRIEFATAPRLRAALRAAPVADVVIVPQALAAELAAAGVTPAAPVPVGRVGVGVAVRPGIDAPDITSPETLKTSLGSADSVVFNRASTGLYVESMLARLGVADAVNAKAERVDDGVSVMRRLLAGRNAREFGFGAITEIVLFRDQGLRLVGPLPAALQNYTAYVALPWPRAAAVPAPAADRAAAAAAFLLHLQGSQARLLFANAGIEPSH